MEAGMPDGDGVLLGVWEARKEAGSVYGGREGKDALGW
jgi:hypothetical protein